MLTGTHLKASFVCACVPKGRPVFTLYSGSWRAIVKYIQEMDCEVNAFILTDSSEKLVTKKPGKKVYLGNPWESRGYCGGWETYCAFDKGLNYAFTNGEHITL